MTSEKNRRGRKRRSGRRHANGRLAYRSPDDRALAANQPHRRVVPEAERLSSLPESMIGQLQARGVINPVQRIAGEHYGQTARLYAATIQGPRALLASGQGQGCDPETCWRNGGCTCLRRERAFFALREVLIRAGHRFESAVANVVVFEKPPNDIEALRLGLSALAIYLRLTSSQNGHK